MLRRIREIIIYCWVAWRKRNGILGGREGSRPLAWSLLSSSPRPLPRLVGSWSLLGSSPRPLPRLVDAPSEGPPPPPPPKSTEITLISQNYAKRFIFFLFFIFYFYWRGGGRPTEVGPPIMSLSSRQLGRSIFN